MTTGAPKRIRILHIMTRYQQGGSERNVVHTIDWERRAGHDVHLAVGSVQDTDETLTDVPVHLVPRLVRSVRPDLDLLAVHDLRALVRSGRYHIVHTHQSKAGVLGRLAAAGGGRRIVHTVHMSSFGQGYGLAASQFYRLAERYCARRTDRMVVVGAELMDRYLAAGVGIRRQYSVIHSPIDLRAYLSVRDLKPDDIRSIRDGMGISRMRPLVAALGALESRKRVDLILRELAPSLRGGSFGLAIGGDGPERGQLEQLTGSLGIADAVRWLGHVDEPAQVIAAADLLVHAGRAEGVSQVVLQALAAGRPAVATASVGLREVEQSNVVVVPWSGFGLGAAVAFTLMEPTRPAPSSSFLPWSIDAVDQQLEVFHKDLVREIDP